MSEFEYFFTLSLFAAGLVLLVYLFRIRTKLMKHATIRLLQAKAKIHYMTRPCVTEAERNWNTAFSQKRDIR